MNTKTKYSILHRSLHWIMAISMIILFVTGFLRMYWMSKKSFLEAMSSQKVDATTEQIKEAYKLIRQPMWEWHEIVANILILAFIVRIVYMLVKGIRFPNPFTKNTPWKERFQGFVYIYFYVFVLISGFTGLSLEYHIFPSQDEAFETIHKWGIYWFPIFIVLHLGGIVIAELTSKKGIVSKMIGGD
jgi:cytochrome b561